jgi:uncharacterized protein (DUF1800 family)
MPGAEASGLRTAYIQRIHMNDIDTPVEPTADTHPNARIGHGTIALSTLASAALAACGGGDSSSTSTSADNGVDAAGLVASTPVPREGAWRFLSQATMGPTEEDIAYVMRYGYDAWLNVQFALPKNDHVQQFLTAIAGLNTQPNAEYARSPWWRGALTGKDQLRQRVAFALSEIVVVSLTNMTLINYPLTVAAWQDLLHRNAFGNYRTFIDEVVRSPAMGYFLSHISNIRPDFDNGLIPDQNFARELLQLFTTGLVKLRDDGTVVMTNNVAEPMSDSQATDVKMLSHVFVGLALNGTLKDASTGLIRPIGYYEGPNQSSDATNPALINPMTPFPGQICLAEEFTKTWATTKVGGNPKLLGADFSWTEGNLDDNVKRALDRIFAHQNVAPFIAKQMIQRLVTSNPSPRYVYRCTQAFRNSDYNLQVLVRTILLDSEARKKPVATDDNFLTFGKVREPLLRVTHLLRAFKAKTTTVGAQPAYFIDASLSNTFNLGRPAHALAQSPLTAVNVFNFFSPNYIASNSEMGKLGKKAPEMQIATETTVASYVSAIHEILEIGFFDIPLRPDVSAESVLDNASIVKAVNDKLMGGSMSKALQDYIFGLLNGVNAATLDGTGRVRMTILMAMASPEYIVQK